MANEAQEPRYEVKMVCEERARPALLAHLRLSSLGLRTLYPPRRVQSVYLDTHEANALTENLAGTSDREKVRFRWYGSHTDTVTGRLERKIRSNMLGTKRTLNLPQPVVVGGAARRAFVAALRAQSPPEWRGVIDAALEPAVWVAYERSYLTTADHSVRVTVDRQLQAWNQRDRAVLGADRAAVIPRILVVECKAPVSRRERLEEVVHSMPLMVDKCSKFVLASAPEHAPGVSELRW